MRTFKIINSTTNEVIKEYSSNMDYQQWQNMKDTLKTLQTSPNWGFSLHYN